MSEYRDLSKEEIISIDIETHDPFLKEKGTGVFRGDSSVLGVSIATGSGFSRYYNLGHYDCDEEERARNIDYLKTVLGNDVPKIGANLLYDIDHLQNGMEIQVNGELNDVQVAEPLIDEYGRYSLDVLGKKYLNKGKEKTEVEVYASNNGWEGDVRVYLHKMPSHVVKDYALADAILPIAIFKKQLEILKEQNLFDLYRMEMDLYPCYLMMRKNGVRIDIGHVEREKKRIEEEINTIEDSLYDRIGWECNTNSTQQKAKLFDELGLFYQYNSPTIKMREKGKTKGNPCIDKKVMENTGHPIIIDMLRVNKAKTCLNTFLKGALTESRIKDRVHCSFFPLRNDNYGTVSGRFSSANPNLQNQPSKLNEASGDVYGPVCRRSYIPEEGMLWFKIDWSQIEYRLICHYASGQGSDEVRKQYNTDPNTDYHQVIMDMTGLERKDAKRLNFSKAYGMSAATMANEFSWEIDFATELSDLYDEKAPFIRKTFYDVMRKAGERGYIKTILGRRARVTKRLKKRKNGSESYESNEFSMFNRLIQGSSADIMKKAMLMAYKEGLFDILYLSLTVHDELDGSVPKTEQGAKALWRLKEVMETCINVRVPLKADLEIGSNWWDLKGINSYEELKESLL